MPKLTNYSILHCQSNISQVLSHDFLSIIAKVCDPKRRFVFFLIQYNEVSHTSISLLVVMLRDGADTEADPQKFGKGIRKPRHLSGRLRASTFRRISIGL